MTKEVRTRFAPSPTGYMHVGNLRTALYTWLIARKNDGKFILRIEDTDQERQVEGATELIYKTLTETGLNWDEGPDKGGDYGPYVQSERLPMYKKYAMELVEKGKAYYCFCDKERLDAAREKMMKEEGMAKYDSHCVSLSKEEVEKQLADGKPYVIRMKMPKDGETTFHDEVFGEITFDNKQLDDIILIKSDGFPTYNFANVVDDHTMGITHVVRGKEYLSSTPKYNLIYDAFGWEKPVYVHVSTVMRDAQRKLSKRDGDASYRDFLDKGYLKEALMNYIALLGWNPGNDKEKFTLDELVEAFSIKGISKSPAIFDENKLKWLNSEYIRAMSLDEFHTHAEPWLKKSITNESIDLKKITPHLHQRTERFSDIVEKVDFFDELKPYDTGMYVHKKMKTDEASSLEILNMILPVLESIETWDQQHIHDALVKMIEDKGVKAGKVLFPLRIALSGKTVTPGGGLELADILGKEETLARMRTGISLLEKRTAVQ